MRLLLPLTVLSVIFLNSQQPKSKPPQPQQTTTADQRGTQELPVVVEVLPATKTPEETAQDKKDREDKTANDWNLVKLTGVLALVAFLQLLVYAYQAKKLRETVESAGEQAEAMERHIGEASRSANAMERIAAVIQTGNAAIIRAYLSVTINTGVYQDRLEGVKFEGKPNLVNTGSTPARNVKIKIASRIVPFAEAETFSYPLTEEIAKAPAVAAPHQTYILSSIVEGFIPDAEVPDVKQGRNGKGALTVWGTVTYDDIFGQNHTTKFGQWIFWTPSQSVYGYYIPGQNDMD